MRLRFWDRSDLEAEQPLEGGHKRFYTVEQLGEKQAITPDGFLLCEDTPIARIGHQVYGEHELPGMRGKDGLLTIERDADEVFRPETIASFHGKPVTNNHPSEKVTPNNYKAHAVGVVLNPRRGDGIVSDNNFLYADLLIHDPQAIADIRTGKREVSAGYDAEYEQTGDGQGRQYDIVGNHVALVNRGRCGPLCSIGDEEMPTRLRVNDSQRRGFRDRLLAAFHSRDEEAFRDQVEQLEKIPEMIGPLVSGEGSGGEGRTGDTHVSINLGPGGGGSGGGGVSLGGGADADDPDPGASGAAPTGQASGANPMMQEFAQRLDRIEKAIVMLAQNSDNGDNGDDPDDPDGFSESDDPDRDRMYGDRRGRGRDRALARDRRTRDEPPTAPPSDEPDEDPGQDLPFGAGSKGEGREGTQLGTEDRRRTGDRRTSDRRRMTGDQQGNRQKFVGDSTSLRTEFQETMSRAELLAPGLRQPTFDSAYAPQMTHDAMCAVRRNALTEAYRDQVKHGYIDTMLGGKPANFGQMSCDALEPIFYGASELVRQANNSQFGRVRPNNQSVRGAGGAPSPAEINARMREKYNIH